MTAQVTSRRPAFAVDLPDGNEYVQLLAPGRSVAMRSGLVTLLPGQECGTHSTESHEEMLICLEGSGALQWEAGKTVNLAQGHVAYVPPMTRHNVRNTGSQRLRYIYVVSPVPAELQESR